MSDEILRIEGLRKRYGRKTVLDGLAWALLPGKVHGLLGVNGSGKTTLVRTALGVVPADGGTVAWKGRRVGPGDPAFLREVGYVPEDSFFYADMTVGTLTAFNSRFYPAWDRGRADSLLDAYGLDRRARVGSLSRGQKLRLGLAQALAARPALLVLDDPTSGLDVPTRRGFLRDVVRALADEGTAVLFASHLVHELERVVDRVAILDGGRIAFDEEAASLEARAVRARLAYVDRPPADLGVPGVLSRTDGERGTDLVVYPWSDDLVARARSAGASAVEVEPLPLEDLFVAFVS